MKKCSYNCSQTESFMLMSLGDQFSPDKDAIEDRRAGFFLPMRRTCSIFRGAGKFCLAHRLRQLTRAVKSDVRTINFKSDVTYKLSRSSEKVVMRR